MDNAELPAEKVSVIERFRFWAGFLLFCAMVGAHIVFEKRFPEWWVIFPALIVGVKTEDAKEIVTGIMKARK